MKEKIAEIIERSSLPEVAKLQELDFLDKAVVEDTLNVPYIQDNMEKTAFAKLYAFLAGYTDASVVIPDNIRVNLRLFNKLGDVAGKLGGVVPYADKAAAVLGTSTTCGLIGGLFNTKKCREKQQATQNSASQFLSSQINNPTIAQPQYITFGGGQQSQTTVESTPATTAARQNTTTQQQQQPQSGFGGNNNMMLIAGIALVAFLILNKKKR